MPLIAWLQRVPATPDLWTPSALLGRDHGLFQVRLWPLAAAGGAAAAGAAAIAALPGAWWWEGAAPAALFLAFVGWALRRPVSCAAAGFAALAVSPQIHVGGLPPEFFYRLDDLVLAALIVRLAVFGRGRESPASPIDRPLLWLLLALAVSTALGLARGFLAHPVESAATLAKLGELTAWFFVLRLIGFDHAARARLRRAALAVLGVVALIGCAWAAAGRLGLLQTLDDALVAAGADGPLLRDFLVWPPLARTFNAGWYRFEPNHFGVLLAMGALLFAGRAAASPRRRTRVLAALGALASAAACVSTGSRGAWVGLAAAGVCYLGHRRRALGWAVAAALGTAAVWAVATLDPWTDPPFAHHGFLEHRLHAWATEYTNYRRARMDRAEGGLGAFSAQRNRFESWETLGRDFPRAPLTGVGLGARPRRFYENQYLMVLSEGGALGLLLFLALHGQTFRWLRALGGRDDREPGLRWAHVVLLAGGLTSIAFFIIRVAGCWWFLLALEPRPPPPPVRVPDARSGETRSPS